MPYHEKLLGILGLKRPNMHFDEIEKGSVIMKIGSLIPKYSWDLDISHRQDRAERMEGIQLSGRAKRIYN